MRNEIEFELELFGIHVAIIEPGLNYYCLEVSVIFAVRC